MDFQAKKSPRAWGKKLTYKNKKQIKLVELNLLVQSQFIKTHLGVITCINAIV